jgi:hypothetical protein
MNDRQKNGFLGQVRTALESRGSMRIIGKEAQGLKDEIAKASDRGKGSPKDLWIAMARKGYKKGDTITYEKIKELRKGWGETAIREEIDSLLDEGGIGVLKRIKKGEYRILITARPKQIEAIDWNLKINNVLGRGGRFNEALGLDAYRLDGRYLGTATVNAIKDVISDVLGQKVVANRYIDRPFMERMVAIAESESRNNGQATNFIKPIDWEERFDEEDNISFSGDNEPDTWKMIRKLIACLRTRHQSMLSVCDLSASVLAYHMVINIGRLNASGNDKITAIQMVFSPSSIQQWLRVKFSNDEKWKVLDMSIFPAESGYYGEEKAVAPYVTGGRIINGEHTLFEPLPGERIIDYKNFHALNHIMTSSSIPVLIEQKIPQHSPVDL